MQRIWIPGRGVGKARPRLGRGGIIFTENRYGAWKREAARVIRELNLKPAPQPCFVECYFVNFFSSDSDNLIGSVLDCLVEAGVLANDSSGYVVGCSGEFVKQRKERNQDKQVGILVIITPAQLRSLEDILALENMA